MVSLPALWLPIVLSAVLVFLVSFVLHTVLKYHQSDYTKLPDEDAIRAAIRSASPEVRQYIIPYAGGMQEMQTAEMKQKFAEGPVGVLTLRRSGEFSMAPNLVQWFAYSVVISCVTAYVASRTLAPGSDYLQVFRVVGTVAWLGYSGAQIQGAIWMGKPWSITMKEVIDGLVYALVTAGVFGWLWPR
jgi:hypothetical protein